MQRCAVGFTSEATKGSSPDTRRKCGKTQETMSEP